MGYELDYHPQRRTKAKMVDGSIIYRAKPNKNNNEKYVTIFLDWHNGKWTAQARKFYKECNGNCGISQEGLFDLNFEARKKLCEFFKIDLHHLNDDTFMHEISNTSPSDLEKFGNYEHN